MGALPKEAKPWAEDRFDLLHEMLDTYWRCSHENWDGNGGKAMRLSSAVDAMRLVGRLPEDCLLPEPSPCLKGNMGLEWRGYGNVASIIDFRENCLFCYVRRGDAIREYEIETVSKFVQSSVMDFIVRMKHEKYSRSGKELEESPNGC